MLLPPSFCFRLCVRPLTCVRVRIESTAWEKVGKTSDKTVVSGGADSIFEFCMSIRSSQGSRMQGRAPRADGFFHGLKSGRSFYVCGCGEQVCAQACEIARMLERLILHNVILRTSQRVKRISAARLAVSSFRQYILFIPFTINSVHYETHVTCGSHAFIQQPL